MAGVCACAYLQCLASYRATGVISVEGKLIVGRWPKLLWLAETPLRSRMLTESSSGLFRDVSEQAALPAFPLLCAKPWCQLPAAAVWAVRRLPWHRLQVEI